MACFAGLGGIGQRLAGLAGKFGRRLPIGILPALLGEKQQAAAAGGLELGRGQAVVGNFFIAVQNLNHVYVGLRRTVR